MKAIWYEEPGEAAAVLQYGDIEQPQPGPGEVLVRVHASGVNPSDTKFRSGWMGAEATLSSNDSPIMMEQASLRQWERGFQPHESENGSGYMKPKEVLPGELQRTL
ncbi:alcohol dehydrogenase catalytic domain-containing protein [Acaryochloris sp. 'Moss Beach']|uniref:alcohol dehydrogenase catalytic domain-containing protein n=1 Tax=Acaryochloris sp. 'Moss Beach' TaxID=2740837 RepID=UPI001F15E625|nr:hypothetical protein [Acaryochloris sp. 'Moss Beach']